MNIIKNRWDGAAELNAAPFCGIRGVYMRRSWHAPVLLLPLAAVTAIVISACVNVMLQSLGHIPAFGLTGITLKYYKEVFSRAEFLSSVWVSVRIAIVSALLSAALGTLLCAALVRRRGNGALYLVRFPILVPHTVVALFVMTMFSQTGIAARLAFAAGGIADYTEFPQLLFTPGFGGAIAAYLWKEIPFVAYYTLSLMSSVSDTLGEAAENLGASPLRSFFSVTLPLSLPATAKATLIIFIYAFGGYELPTLLGATLPKALPVQAYITYYSPDLTQRPLAMAMFGVILLLSLGMAALYAAGMRRLIRRTGGGA